MDSMQLSKIIKNMEIEIKMLLNKILSPFVLVLVMLSTSMSNASELNLVNNSKNDLEFYIFIGQNIYDGNNAHNTIVKSGKKSTVNPDVSGNAGVTSYCGKSLYIAATPVGSSPEKMVSNKKVRVSCGNGRAQMTVN